MDDIKHLKIGASQLSIGMFVTELDIPWLESPFLMQGFVIENDQEIATLQKCCQYVYIDRTKSTGAQFVAAAKQNVAFKREGITVEISSEDPNQQKTDRQKIAEAQAKANALANKAILKHLAKYVVLRHIDYIRHI